MPDSKKPEVPSYPGNGPVDWEEVQDADPALRGRDHYVSPHDPGQERRSENPAPITHYAFQKIVADELNTRSAPARKITNTALTLILEYFEQPEVQSLLAQTKSRSTTHSDFITSATTILQEFVTSRRLVESQLLNTRDVLLAVHREVEAKGLQNDDKLGRLHEYCAVALEHMPNLAMLRNLQVIATPPGAGSDLGGR